MSFEGREVTDYDRMEAGREMDAAVAERVMGEARPTREFTISEFDTAMVGTPVLSPQGCWYGVFEFEKGDKGEWVPMPYSTDIAAAWKVVERLKSLGWHVQIKMSEGTKCLCALENDSDDWCGYEDTAPLAICRVALRAVSKAAEAAA